MTPQLTPRRPGLLPAFLRPRLSAAAAWAGAMPLLAGLAMGLVAGRAQATDFPIATPTPDPFAYVVHYIDHPGIFSDNYFFEVKSTAPIPSYVWTFPFNPAGDSALIFETSSLFLQVFNQDSGALLGYGFTPGQWGFDPYGDPAIAPYFLALKAQGFDTNESLFWKGDLGAGHYRATVTGWAGGPLSVQFGGGGLTLTKIGVPDVPEPSSSAMLLAGLLVVGGFMQGQRRRQN